tara:strand:+ start:477 stop:833 length:357 start_codon:yes stop_codon:yes gene_type:complete
MLHETKNNKSSKTFNLKTLPKGITKENSEIRKLKILNKRSEQKNTRLTKKNISLNEKIHQITIDKTRQALKINELEEKINVLESDCNKYKSMFLETARLVIDFDDNDDFDNMLDFDIN